MLQSTGLRTYYLFHKSYPRSFLLLPGLPSWTIAWTVSSELLGLCF